MSVSPTWAEDLVVEDENGGCDHLLVESKEEGSKSRRSSCAGEEGDACMPLVNDTFAVENSKESEGGDSSSVGCGKHAQWQLPPLSDSGLQVAPLRGGSFRQLPETSSEQTRSSPRCDLDGGDTKEDGRSSPMDKVEVDMLRACASLRKKTLARSDSGASHVGDAEKRSGGASRASPATGARRLSVFGGGEGGTANSHRQRMNSIVPGSERPSSFRATAGVRGSLNARAPIGEARLTAAVAAGGGVRRQSAAIAAMRRGSSVLESARRGSVLESALLKTKVLTDKVVEVARKPRKSIEAIEELEYDMVQKETFRLVKPRSSATELPSLDPAAAAFAAVNGAKGDGSVGFGGGRRSKHGALGPGVKRRVSSITLLLKPHIVPKDPELGTSTMSRRSKLMSEKHTLFPEDSGGVMSPHTIHKMVWDALMLCCTSYVMIVTPFELTFVANQTCSFRSNLFVANTTINMAFAIDMLLILNTSYFDSNRRSWVVDRRVIAWRYLRTWFLFDAASVMPVDCLTAFRAFKYARLVRITRFFKLLKVLKSPRVIQAISMHWDFSGTL